MATVTVPWYHNIFNHNLPSSTETAMDTANYATISGFKIIECSDKWYFSESEVSSNYPYPPSTKFNH